LDTEALGGERCGSQTVCMHDGDQKGEVLTDMLRRKG